jgi:hypothetical protein
VLHKFPKDAYREILGLRVPGSYHWEECLPWFQEPKQRAIVTGKAKNKTKENKSNIVFNKKYR